MGNLRVQRRRGSGRREGGASLVEFALVLPLLTLLLLGTLTGGLTLSRQNSVKNAVREATRFGAVYPIDDGNAATTNDMREYLRAVYRQAEGGATGDLGPNVADRYICVAFITSTSRVFKDADNASAPTTGQCFDDGISTVATDPANKPRVQVLARRSSDIEALLFSQTVTLESRSVTRYERS